MIAAGVNAKARSTYLGHSSIQITSKRKRSRLTLPIVPGVNVPTGLPPCPGLRGEPCRAYKP